MRVIVRVIMRVIVRVIMRTIAATSSGCPTCRRDDDDDDDDDDAAVPFLSCQDRSGHSGRLSLSLSLSLSPSLSLFLPRSLDQTSTQEEVAQVSAAIAAAVTSAGRWLVGDHDSTHEPRSAAGPPRPTRAAACAAIPQGGDVSGASR